ncbi:MAG: cobalamin biosynthesis protein CobQ [Thermoprotei archaeon]|nr:MAG: cobalamin biosynthesis protein CobQ [Thermoprotei archaeon]RLF24734.1 MAG: cobalamin biosynthesis protein CobQ [Thermoprotei archaeon]
MHSNVQVIGVLGGKGGTGKTTIALSIAYLLAKMKHDVVYIDADVDNPSSKVFMEQVEIVKELKAFIPSIDTRKCTGCSICVRNCPENALVAPPGRPPSLIAELCNGCTICKIVCPHDAVKEDYRIMGYIWRGKLKDLVVIGGEIVPGDERSPLVAHLLIDYVKDNVKNKILLVDCPPGAGSIISEVLNISNIVLVITEPTPMGIHDLKLVLDLNKRFKRQCIIVVNKVGEFDGWESFIREVWEIAKGLPFVYTLTMVPYDEVVHTAYSSGDLNKLMDEKRPFYRVINSLARLVEGVFND